MIPMRMVPGLLLAVSAALLPISSYAQTDGDPVPLGRYRVLRSQVLGEDRVLQVLLPRGYTESELDYPVVYLFYSDLLEVYYAQAAHELHMLGLDLMPQAILVGVANTQRYRDLLVWPQEGRPNTGQAHRFLDFVRDELIPFVDSEYRTKPYRIMVGPQAAAVFGAYALVQEPGLFHAFLLNDPCRQDTEARSLCAEVVEASRSPGHAGTYFAVSHTLGDDRWDPSRLEELRAGLSVEATESFRWRINLVPDWPLFLAPLQIREGLLDLFSSFPFDRHEAPPTLNRIRAHYADLSRELGFILDPPDQILALSADVLSEAGHRREAKEVLDFLVETYPASMDGIWQLGNLHRAMGDTATAIRYYEECLRRDPNMTPAREWLRRLGGGN